MANSQEPQTRSGWRRLIEAMVLIGAGILVAAVVAELLLRAFRPQVFEIHPPGMYTQDSAVGYTLTPGFAGTIRRSEFTVPVTIGEGGLRSWDGAAKAPGTFRVLVLGDSQAFGFGVGDDETLAHQLGELLSRAHPGRAIEVLNAGVPGYGTADQVAFLKQEGDRLDPDLIILQFLSVNDLKENRYPAVTWARIEDGMLTAVQEVDASQEELEDKLWRWHRYLKLHSHLLRLSSDSAGYLAIRMGWSGGQESMWGEDFDAEDAQRGERLLVELVDIGRDLGADTMFLFTTGQAHVLEGSVETLRSRGVLESAANRAGVPWIDVGTVLSRRPDRLDLYYRKDGHWTAQGHRAVAEIVADRIELPPVEVEDHGAAVATDDEGSGAVR